MAHQPAQKLDRVLPVERLQADTGRRIEAGQAPAAVDEHPGGAGARKERSDLVVSGRVVQYDEHASTRQEAAVGGGAFGRRGGEVGGVHAQGVEESAEDPRRRRRLDGVRAAQLGVQLPVREGRRQTGGRRAG